MKKIVGSKIIRLKEVDSTNKLALSEEYSDSPSGTVIIAEEQSAGKGRKNRIWYSKKGGIYMSILFNKVKDYSTFYKLAILSALAVKDVLSRYTEDRYYVKWPNDLYYEDKKICGILLQSKTQGDDNRLVLGIGININNSISELPKEVRDKSASLIDIIGKKIDKEEIITNLLGRINIYYNELLNGQFKKYLKLVNDCLYKKGRITEFLIGVYFRKLRVLEVDTDGELIVEDEKEQRLKVDFGEIL